jgi:hypothetical protein
MKDLQIEPLFRYLKLLPYSLIRKSLHKFFNVVRLKQISLRLDKVVYYVFQLKRLDFIMPLTHEKEKIRNIDIVLKRQNISLNPILNLNQKP